MTNQPNEYDVAAEVRALTERWNPPPSDHSLERLVGVPTEPGDVAATAHVPMEELNKSFTNSDVDAQRLSEFQDDGDDADALEDMDKAALKDEAESRGLAVSGSKDDLKARIREHDAGGEG
jgi:hypothetical protein